MTTHATLISAGDQEGLRQYTPNADVVAGQIIVIGARPFVAVRDIPANTVGTLSGWGGLYKLPKNGSSGPVVTDGEEIAWITGSSLATDVITGNKHFGYAEADAGANQDYVMARHLPRGATTNTTS